MIERRATMKRKDWKLLLKKSRHIDIVLARSIFIEQIYVCLKLLREGQLHNQTEEASVKNVVLDEQHFTQDFPEEKAYYLKKNRALFFNG